MKKVDDFNLSTQQPQDALRQRILTFSVISAQRGYRMYKIIVYLVIYISLALPLIIDRDIDY